MWWFWINNSLQIDLTIFIHPSNMIGSLNLYSVWRFFVSWSMILPRGMSKETEEIIASNNYNGIWSHFCLSFWTTNWHILKVSLSFLWHAQWFQHCLLNLKKSSEGYMYRQVYGDTVKGHIWGTSHAKSSRVPDGLHQYTTSPWTNILSNAW